jgi:hypothetical protein
MNDKNLAKKLTWMVLLKIAALYLLWWLFISDQKVEVTAETMSHVIENKKVGETHNDQ